MAITNASRLADFGSGIGTQGSVIQVDNANKRVGLGTTNPQSTLQVGIAITMDGTAGVITAQSYYGDGSTLTGIGQTVNVGTSNLFVVGVSTFGAGVAGTIRANGDVTFAGVVTATSFSGDGSSLTGIADTAHVSTTGLVVVGVSTLSGNVQIPDSTSLYLGNDDDLELFHTAGGNTYIKNNTGELEIRGNTTKIFNKSSSQTIAGFTQGASVGITTVGILTAYSDVAIGVGATIHASSGNAVFAGIVTATTLKYGTTSVETAIDAKASTGKAIAMAMVFG